MTAALDLNPPDQRRFTQRITEGRDDQGETCGRRWREAAAFGSFQNAKSAEELIFEILPFDESGPISGDHPFSLTYGMTAVLIVVTTRSDAFGARLAGPNGTHQLAPGEGVFTVSGATVEPHWLAQKAFVLVLWLPPESPQEWVGEWNLAFLPDDQSLSEVQFFGFLAVAPVSEQVALDVGETSTIAFTVTDHGEQVPTSDELADLVSSAVIVTDGGREIVAGSWVSDGVFEVPITAPPEPGTFTVYTTVAIEVPGTSVTLPFDGDPALVSVTPAPPPTTTMNLPAPTLPAVTTNTLELPDLIGSVSVTAQDAITVVGGSIPGCVLLEAITIDSAPTEAGLTVRVTRAGAPLDASNESCIGVMGRSRDGAIDPEESVRLSVDMAADDRALGKVEGTITLVTAGDDEVRETYTVAFHGALVLKPPSPWAWLILKAGIVVGIALLLILTTYRVWKRRVFVPVPDLRTPRGGLRDLDSR